MSDEIQVEGEELPHLLLVDDDATFTRVMARAMSRRGFRVSTAGSAEEGLAIATQHPEWLLEKNGFKPLPTWPDAVHRYLEALKADGFFD